MARTNQGVVVLNKNDPTPTDSEGGYAGGDSTAAAIAQVGGAATNAQTAATNAQTAAADAKTAAADVKATVNSMPRISPSTVAGLLDYTTATGTDTTPVTILSDAFAGDGPLSGRIPITGPAWSAASVWTTSGGRAVASGIGGATLQASRGDDIDVLFDLAVTTAGTGTAQTWRVYAAALASGTTLTDGVWVGISVPAAGGCTASLWRTVGGTSTQLGSIPLSGVQTTATPQPVRVALTLRGGQVVANISNGSGGTYGSLTVAETARPGTLLGISPQGAAPGLALDALTVTRPRVPADTPPTGRIITATTDGSLPSTVLTALDARYGTALVGSALEQLRTLRAFAAGTVDVAVVSDSTGNDGNDWVRIWARKWGANLPADVRRTYRSWDATAGAWRAETVDNAGAAPSTGVIVDDDFSTTGNVLGSTPDTGPTWSGTGTSWVSDGNLATLTASYGTLSQNLASKDQTVRFVLSVLTTGQATTSTLRVYAGSAGSSLSSGVWLSLGINSSGVLTATLYKTIGGTTTTIGSTVVVAGVTANSGVAQAVTVEVATSIQNVTGKVTVGAQTTTLTATLPESEVEALGPWAGVYGVPPASATYGYRLDSARLHTPAASNPTAPPTFAVHNGAIAGGKLDVNFTQAQLTTMFGNVTPKVLILTIGHNNGAQSATGFVAEVQAWIGLWRKRYPGCAILVSSQNPQVPPATGIVAHRDRQAALRVWAKGAGFDYVPAFEAFAAKPDGGVSLIISDGIHPTTPPGTDLTGTYGSVLWADTFAAAI